MKIADNETTRKDKQHNQTTRTNINYNQNSKTKKHQTKPKLKKLTYNSLEMTLDLSLVNLGDKVEKKEQNGL